jgi:hypothetical protein
MSEMDVIAQETRKPQAAFQISFDKEEEEYLVTVLL